MLNKVSAKNFLSWKELNFPVVNQITLIDGWNEDDQRSEGSGKSSILNAISWAAFGKLPKDANVDEVIKDGESSCSVVLEFDNGDAIVRSRKPNELYLMKAGTTIKGKDARETQAFIEEYIGCNFETFCQSVYFAQNYDKKFLSSNQEDKGKILSSIQNLQIFDKARKETMDLAKLEESKIAKLNNEIQIQQNNLNNYQSQKALVSSFIQDKIQKHKNQVNMMTQQKDILMGHIRGAALGLKTAASSASEINLDALTNDEIELNQAKSGLNSQLSDLTYQKGQFETIRKSIVAKETEGRNLANRYQSLEQKINIANGTEGTARLRTLISNKNKVLNLDTNVTRTRLMVKEAQLIEFINNPTKICPSCGSELASADTTHSLNELAQIQKDIKDIESNSQVQADEIDLQIVTEMVAATDQLNSQKEEASNILIQLQAVSEYLDQNKVPVMDELLAKEFECKTVISQINEALHQTQQKKMQHAQYTSQMHSYATQEAAYRQQHAQLETQISQLGEPDVSQDIIKLKALEQELVNVQTKLQEVNSLLEFSNIYLNQLETLKDGFKDIKSYVFTNALNELNYRTNQYLNDLFDMEATIKFSNEDQKIEMRNSYRWKT